MKRVRRTCLASFLLLSASCLSAACSDSSSPDATGDAGPGGGGDSGTCGPVGNSCKNVCTDTSCTSDCPEGFKCEGNGEKTVCVANRDGCGGFVPKNCPAAAPRCVVVSGAADYAVCMTDRERACVCSRSPGSFICG